MHSGELHNQLLKNVFITVIMDLPTSVCMHVGHTVYGSWAYCA